VNRAAIARVSGECASNGVPNAPDGSNIGARLTPLELERSGRYVRSDAGRVTRPFIRPDEASPEAPRASPGAD
jgi:hypothetical protein